MKRLLFLILVNGGVLLALNGQAGPINPAVKRLIDLGYEVEEVQKDTAKAAAYARQALTLSGERKDRAGEAASLVLLGTLAKNRGNYPLAKQHYRNARTIRAALDDRHGVASCDNNLGLVEKDLGHFEQAREYFESGLSSLRNETDCLRGTLLSNLGITQKMLGRYAEAVRRLEESIAFRAKYCKNAKGLADSHLNLASVFQDLNHYSLAGKHLGKSLEWYRSANDKKGIAKSYLLLGNNDFFTKEYTVAAARYDTVLLLRAYLSRADLVRAYRNVGSICKELGFFERALSNYQFALDSFRAVENFPEVASVLFDIGNLYHAQGRYELAAAKYEESLNVLDTFAFPVLRADILYNLSDSYERLGQPARANEFLKQHVIEKEKTLQSAQAAANLSAQLMAQKNELQALKTEKLVNQRAYLIVGALLISLVAVLSFVFFRQKRLAAEKSAEVARQEAEISRQQSVIAEQKAGLADQKAALAGKELEKVLKDKELEIIYAGNAAREQEQDRMAKDLHDGLGGKLAAVKLFFANIDPDAGEPPEATRIHYKRGNELLDEACQDVRRIAHDMMATGLKRFGLKAQLEALADTLRETRRLRVDLSTHGLETQPLDFEIAKMAYRSIQELVTNAVRHARASRVAIEVSRFKERLNIMVMDDGAGFDPDAPGEKAGAGLQSIASRVHHFDGAFSIDSGKGRGTTVIIDVPAPAGEPARQ